MTAGPVAIAIDDAAQADWVGFIVEGLQLDGFDAQLIEGADLPAGTAMLVIVCTTASKPTMTSRHAQSPARVIPVLREGTPETALPDWVEDGLYIDLREGVTHKGELERLWQTLAGSPLAATPLTQAERHLNDLAKAEGPQVAGWSAVTWADEAHGRDDFATEWFLRRLAAELLQRGQEHDEALVQARRGLMAALIVDATSGIAVHDALIESME